MQSELMAANESPSRIPVSLLAFLPGTILGLHLGAAVAQGITAAIQRTTVNPMASARFFVGFAAITFAITFVYRIPRWLVAGPHRILWWSALLSGTLMVGLGYSTVVALEQLGFIASAGPPSATTTGLLILTVAARTALSVELEAYAGRVCNVRNGG